MHDIFFKSGINRSPFVVVNIGEQRHLPASNANAWVENKQAASRPVCRFVHQQASWLLVRNLSKKLDIGIYNI